MKRFLSILMIALMFAIGFGSCNSCSNGSKTEEPAQLEMVDSVVAELNVEHLIALDRQAMYMKAGEDYRWFETGVVLNNYLDEDNDGSIEMVVNVFQSVIERENGSADTWVFKFQHTAEGTYEEQVHGFWVEDLPMNEEAVTVTFEQAYERVMEVNLPKPHTRQVVLRKQLGPKPCNPQWIFGNQRAQIYVDAMTGEVSSINPAFGEMYLGMPLGEWP